MRQLASVLLLIATAVPLGAKWKVKEKHFDPVRVMNVLQVEGRYVGIDPDYVIQIQVDAAGRIDGAFTQFGVRSPLRDIRIDGAEMNATVGGLPLHGTFVNRVRNGATTFGLLVHDADVEVSGGVTVSEIFCGRK